MAYEQKNNSGALFLNDRKEKDTHPDYTGTVMVNDVEMYINAWTRSGAKDDYFSLSFKEKKQ